MHSPAQSAQINPFFAAHETSLSKLTDGEWSQVSCRWARGIDWMVQKVGKKWMLTGEHFTGFPLFRTKGAAYKAGSILILAESHWRAAQRWEIGRAA